MSRLFSLLILFLSSTTLAQEQITLGLNLPLSGDVSEFGYAVRNGFELAREELSPALDTVKFIYEDNRYEGKHSVSAFNRLRDLGKADLVFIWGDLPSLAVAPVAERTGPPLFAVLTDHKSVRKMKKVIRFINSFDQYAAALMSEMQEREYKKIAILMTDIAYYRNYADALAESAEEGQEVTVIDTFSPHDTDFKPSLLKVLKGEYDALGVFVYPSQILTMLKQAKDLGLNLPTFGGDDYESKKLIADAKGGMDGGLYALNIVTDEFRKRYINRYKTDSHIGYAAQAYEFARLVATEVKQPVTIETIRATFQKLGERDGAAGPFTYRETEEHGNYFHFKIVVKEIQGDTIKIVRRIN